MQTRAVCAAAGLKPKGFALAKTLHGALSAALCVLALKLFPLAAVQPRRIPSRIKKRRVFNGVIFVVATLFIVTGIRLASKARGAGQSFRFD